MSARQIRGNDQDYHTIRKLGGGSFGRVYLVEKRSNGRKMACKEVNVLKLARSSGSGSMIGSTSRSSTTSRKGTGLLDRHLLELVHQELKMMSALSRDENVVSFSGDCAVDMSAGIFRIYMQYYPGGDLMSVIETQGANGLPIFPLAILNWTWNIAKGLESCHRRGYLHRDIKPANVLLEYPHDHDDLLWAINNGDNLSSAKYQSDMRQIAREPQSFISDCHVSDFGLCKYSIDLMMKAGTLGSRTTGTPGFMAPEVNRTPPVFSTKSDMYAFGVTVYCLCTLTLNPPSARRFSRIPERYPSEIRDLVERCVEREPARRPHAREAVSILERVVKREHTKFSNQAPTMWRLG